MVLICLFYFAVFYTYYFPMLAHWSLVGQFQGSWFTFWSPSQLLLKRIFDFRVYVTLAAQNRLITIPKTPRNHGTLVTTVVKILLPLTCRKKTETARKFFLGPSRICWSRRLSRNELRTIISRQPHSSIIYLYIPGEFLT